MEASAPQQPDDEGEQRNRARLAAWCQAAGAVLALATLTLSLLDVITPQQAIALGLVAALLIIGGLIVTAGPDLSVGFRSGFRAGLRAGSLVGRLRSLFRRCGNGGLGCRQET